PTAFYPLSLHDALPISLALASRLALMGQMATTLAHELGQPLNACQSYLAGIRHRLHSGTLDREAFAGALEKASAHLDQAGDIIRDRKSTRLNSKSRENL